MLYARVIMYIHVCACTNLPLSVVMLQYKLQCMCEVIVPLHLKVVHVAGGGAGGIMQGAVAGVKRSGDDKEWARVLRVHTPAPISVMLDPIEITLVLIEIAATRTVSAGVTGSIQARVHVYTPSSALRGQGLRLPACPCTCMA